MTTNSGGWTLIARASTTDTSLSNYNTEGGTPWGSNDYSMGLDKYKALIEIHSSSTIETAVSGTDTDSTERWEVGVFNTSDVSAITSQVGELPGACNDYILDLPMLSLIT